MVETAIEVSRGEVSTSAIAELIRIGKEMLAHPVELLDGAREAIESTAERAQVVLITKGDLFDQESKLARSGLGDLFDAIEIVSEKDESRYRRVLAKHDVAPERFVMVGNSVRSDIIPVVRIGGFAVHVPYHVTWALEEADPSTLPPASWTRIEHLGQLPEVLDGFSRAAG
jgi:putative hydrolase of the HAD superfamily